MCPCVSWSQPQSPNQEAFGEYLGGGGVGAEGPEGTLPGSWFRLHAQGRRSALGLHGRPVPMYPWPSPCRRSRAFPEMITISHSSLSAAAEPCQGPNHTLSFHSMSEQTCVLSINISVDHWWAFPSQPSRAAEVASSPREGPRGAASVAPGPWEAGCWAVPRLSREGSHSVTQPQRGTAHLSRAPWEEVQVRLRASF